MSGNPLFEGILGQARADADRILAQARKEAEEIAAAGSEKAERARADERKARAARLEGLRLREENARRSVERLEELRGADAANDAVMAEVSRLFDDWFSRPESKETLVEWTAEAALGLGESEAKVSARGGGGLTESDLRKAEKLLLERTGAEVRLTLDKARGTMDWGVVLSSADDKVYYNNQLSTRLRRAQRDVKRIIQESTCKAES